MIPRYGAPPRRGIGYKARPGAYALICRRDRVLLTHQAAPQPEYQLPGGGIDPGESPLHALHREVKEETGYSIGRPRLIGFYRRFCYMPEYDRHVEKMCSVWSAWAGLRLNAPSEAGHTAHWLSAREALDLLADPGGRALALRGLRQIRLV